MQTLRNLTEINEVAPDAPSPAKWTFINLSFDFKRNHHEKIFEAYCHSCMHLCDLCRFREK